MEEMTREQLEEQVELLKQQLGELTGTSQELGVILAIRHGMTARLATMLYILVKRSPAIISRSTFHSIIYGDRLDGGPEPKIFDVHISRLRGILRRIDAPGKIDTIWGVGYRASPDLVNWVKALFDQHIPQEK